MKVLFIDGDPLVRRQLQTIIPWRNYGFSSYLEADNGADALVQINLENPELILLDFHLKDMPEMTILHEIKKYDYAGRVIIVTEDTCFANAKLAVNYGITAYLNKPADPKELTEAVLRVIDEIYRTKFISIYYEQSAILSKNNLLSNILLGNMTYVKEMESIYHIDLNSNYFRLIAFHLSEEIDNDNMWKEALRLTKNCLSVVFSPTKLVLIAQSPNQEQFILRQLEACQAKYPQYTSLLKIISSQTGLHTELSTLYTEISRVYQNLYYYKEKQSSTLYADALSQRLGRIQQADFNFISFTENMIRRILLLQSSELEEETLSLLDFLALRKPPRDNAQFMLINCYTQIVSALTEHYPLLEFEISDRKALASHLSDDRYLCDSISYINDQFQKAAAYIGSASRKNPCQRVCQYIDANFAMPLKLNAIANLFGYNSAYLGRLFVLETGMNFNTYLNRIRMEKATEYLKKGVPVIQTSEFSGFTDPDYFTKKFKKYMGMLPSEYRAQHLENAMSNKHFFN